MENQGLNQIVKALAKKAEREAAQELVNTQIELLAAGFDRAIAYANVIILAGYAGFFGLWQLTKGMISETLALWATLLMAISVVVFVMFEVWKVYFTAHDLQELQRIASDPSMTTSPTAFLEAVNRYKTDGKKKLVVAGGVWILVLYVTVATGLGGAGLLMIGFIHALASS